MSVTRYPIRVSFKRVNVHSVYLKFGANQCIDISDRNIMATTSTTQLTWLPSDPCPRKGAIIDWNLSYKAPGLPTSRQFRSGTPAFMAVDLLDPNANIPQRTLKHDLESFFAVLLYITLSHDNPKWQKSSFARAFDMAKDFEAIYFIKTSLLFRKSQFKKDCLALVRLRRHWKICVLCSIRTALRVAAASICFER